MEMTRIEKAIENLLVSSKGEVRSRIEEVSFNIKVKDTESLCHCYCLKANANGNLRLPDLIEYIDHKIVEYAIPKKEIDEAKKYLNETGSVSKILALRKKAEKLFVDLEKTGEGGEILLYILTQEFLKLPQLISKMSLKTSGKLHYQGADSVHVKYNSLNDTLELYWGEAKMYSKVNDAIKECMESINGFLLDPFSSSSVQERDLQLITSNIASNVNDAELEDLLVRYFDKDDDLSNSLVYKGVCFIGYDYDKYPIGITKNSTEKIKLEIEKELPQWHDNLGKRIKSFSPLELKEMHIFLMPFPSVAKFREYYLKEIK